MALISYRDLIAPSDIDNLKALLAAVNPEEGYSLWLPALLDEIARCAFLEGHRLGIDEAMVSIEDAKNMFADYN